MVLSPPLNFYANTIFKFPDYICFSKTFKFTKSNFFLLFQAFWFLVWASQKASESWAETTKWPARLCVTWIAGLTLQTRGNRSTFWTWRLSRRPHLPRSRDCIQFRSTLHQKHCSALQGQPPLDGVSLQTLLSCLPLTWATLQGLPDSPAITCQGRPQK